jgi:hypothetical protein
MVDHLLTDRHRRQGVRIHQQQFLLDAESPHQIPPRKKPPPS